ncbi:MAG: TIGR02757 family protein [Balneolaceae bacterium]|nr:TIGR02757 family protein [Balneolaceae bacterium]
MARKLRKASTKQLKELKPFLDMWVQKVEKSAYVEDDPVLFMHAFEEKEDQLLAGFFAALFAWGRRDVVIKKTADLLERMGNRPADFIRAFKEKDHDQFKRFKHRTFKPIDIYWLIRILQKILGKYHSFESFWTHCYNLSIEQEKNLIAVFNEEFFTLCPDVAQRTHKHISNPEKNSSSKRLYLYLKWAVRRNSPVDLGLMNFMPASELMIPLDVHVARQARKLGLLTRTYNDWKAVVELTQSLRKLDPYDPVKYDYALFGLGVNENEIPKKFLLNDS